MMSWVMRSPSCSQIRMSRASTERSGNSSRSSFSSVLVVERVGWCCVLRRRAFGQLGLEAVADPEVRVDVAPVGREALDLLAHLPHEDVDRAVAVHHRVAPHVLVDLVALENSAARL